MLTAAVLASAEKIINTALRYDPGTRLGLAPLTGKILAIHITAPLATTVFVMPLDDEIQLMANWDGEVDTHLSGSLMALINVATTNTHNLKYSGVSVSGDLGLLSALQHLLKNLDIDWEDMLSQFTGDIIGHQTAQMLRGKFGWLKERANNAQRLATEFVTEEYRALVSKPELDDFNNQVDELRLAVDRAAAKVQELMARRSKNP